MNIIKEQNDNLSLQLKISVDELDYNERVKKELNKLRGKAQMPGFRQGHVPFGLMQKMYGKAVLADEINKMLQESVAKFLEDEKIDLLGAPFPAQDSPNIDFENDTQFNFTLNVVLTPEVNLDFLKTFPATYYKIKATDAVIDEQISALRKQFGTEEPDPDDPEKTRRIECELNEDFFKKISPHKEITEKELRQTIAEEHNKACAETVNIWFLNTNFDPIIKAANLQYNDDLFREYVEYQKQAHHEEREQEEEPPEDYTLSDQEFEKTKKGTSWQLIQHKMMEIYNIKIEPDEIKQAAKEQIGHYFGIDPKMAEIQMGEYMSSLVDNVMKDEKQVQQFYNRVLDKKIVQILIENMQVTTKEITWDEFLEIIDPKKEKPATPSQKTGKTAASKKDDDTSEEEKPKAKKKTKKDNSEELQF